MPVRKYAVPSLVITSLMLWTLGCGETPTSPDGPLFKKGQPPASKVSLVNLNLASTQFSIGGPGVAYTVDIENTGGKLTSVGLQAEIHQGSTLKGAGGTMVMCKPEIGLLPHGTCTVAFEAGAYNTNGGVGTLVAGTATLFFYVFGADGSQLTTLSVAITLQ